MPPPLPAEVVVVPPEVGPQCWPPLGGAGVYPPLRLCYSRSPRWREEHVLKIRCCIPIIADVMVDWGKSILVTPRPPPLAHPKMLPNIFTCPLLYPLVFEGHGDDHLT